jgi:hypothetical protein
VYRLRLFKNGTERVVTIDDYIPCSILDNETLVGASASSRYLWIHLLLKAYSKLNGTYGGLLVRERHPIEVLGDFSEFPLTVYDLKTEAFSGDSFKLLQSF